LLRYHGYRIRSDRNHIFRDGNSGGAADTLSTSDKSIFNAVKFFKENPIPLFNASCDVVTALDCPSISWLKSRVKLKHTLFMRRFHPRLLSIFQRDFEQVYSLGAIFNGAPGNGKS